MPSTQSRTRPRFAVSICLVYFLSTMSWVIRDTKTCDCSSVSFFSAFVFYDYFFQNSGLGAPAPNFTSDLTFIASEVSFLSQGGL